MSTGEIVAGTGGKDRFRRRRWTKTKSAWGGMSSLRPVTRGDSSGAAGNSPERLFDGGAVQPKRVLRLFFRHFLRWTYRGRRGEVGDDNGELGALCNRRKGEGDVGARREGALSRGATWASEAMVSRRRPWRAGAGGRGDGEATGRGRRDRTRRQVGAVVEAVARAQAQCAGAGRGPGSSVRGAGVTGAQLEQVRWGRSGDETRREGGAGVKVGGEQVAAEGAGRARRSQSGTGAAGARSGRPGPGWAKERPGRDWVKPNRRRGYLK